MKESANSLLDWNSLDAKVDVWHGHFGQAWWQRHCTGGSGLWIWMIFFVAKKWPFFGSFRWGDFDLHHASLHIYCLQANASSSAKSQHSKVYRLYGISTFEEVLCLYGLYTYFQQKGSNLQGRPMVTPLTSSTLLAKRCAVMRFPVEVFSFCLHGACWRLLHMPGRWRIWKWERRIAQGPLTFPLNSPWYKQRLLSHREKATKST